MNTAGERSEHIPLDAQAAASIAADLKRCVEQLEIPLGIAIDDHQLQLLGNYCQLLWAWNEQINLTRHTTAELFVARDLLDAARLAATLEEGEKVLDFGSGCGVPGIPLMILRPDTMVHLCDSVQKKAKVLTAITKELGLATRVWDTGVVQVVSRQKYNTLTARAVAPIAKMCTWLGPYWGRFGRVLTVKGKSWTDERAEARHLGKLKHVQLRKLDEYPTPGRDGLSVVLQLRLERRENFSPD